MMNQGRKQRPVSVEDLLRLKRAERPPVEFWNQFERELRAKQLAALVEKRPWWREVSLAHVWSGLRRYHLPLGAAAILAVTVVSIRNYQPSRVSPVVAEPAVAAVAAFTPSASVEPVAPVVAASAFVESSPAAVAVSLPVEPAESLSSAPALAADAAPINSLAQMIPVLAVATGTDDAAPASSPSAKLIAENFAAQSSDNSGFSRQVLTAPRGFESRALPARNRPVEPLAQIKIPTSRRSTLLASAIPVASSGPVLNSERSARSLSDERLYDSVTRVSARGAGVAVKF